MININSDIRNSQLSLELLQPYENALRLANPGINAMQARTMVYWALATYYDQFDPKPLLLVYKSFGSGKTDLLSALFPMVKDGRYIQGNTNATVRDEMNQCTTAFFDERDGSEDVVPENLLRRRFKQVNSQISVNRSEGTGRFTRRELNINGWTALARRSLFHDVALMSRCIVITPDKASDEQLTNASVTNAGNLQEVVNQLGTIEQLPGTGRAMQVWMPLITLAFRFNDIEWIGYAGSNFTSDSEEHELSRQYEPEEVVENAFQICMNSTHVIKLPGNWIKISDVKRTANTEFEKDFKPEQVTAMLRRKGHQVSKIDGYPAVKVV